MLRRNFIALTAVGVGALAAGLPGSAEARAEAVRPVLLLRTQGDQTVVAGLHDALDAHGLARPKELALDRPIIFNPVALRALLQQYKGYRMVGVMDDCSAILLNSALMDVRARVLCSGHHIGGGSENAPSRHIFSASSRVSGITSAAHDTKGIAWTRALGGSLGLIAAGLWVPRPEADLAANAGGTLPDATVKMASLIADL